MTDATAYMLQRLTAMILAPLVIIHLVLIVYAIEGGLTASEILNRTRSNLLWPILYTLFVVAVAIHAPLGLRNIIREWTAVRGNALDWMMATFAGVLLITGLRAVWAIAV